jgi:hypothetical protein
VYEPTSPFLPSSSPSHLVKEGESDQGEHEGTKMDGAALLNV